MLDDLNVPAYLLANHMSVISERCYCAGWQMGIEGALWEAVQYGPQNYGQDAITQRDIDILKFLSNAAGGWIVWEDDTEETFIPFEEWYERYRVCSDGLI